MTVRPHHVARAAWGDVRLDQKEPQGLYEQERDSSRPKRRKVKASPFMADVVL